MNKESDFSQTIKSLGGISSNPKKDSKVLEDTGSEIVNIIAGLVVTLIFRRFF